MFVNEFLVYNIEYNDEEVHQHSSICKNNLISNKNWYTYQIPLYDNQYILTLTLELIIMLV